jgi:transposase
MERIDTICSPSSSLNADGNTRCDLIMMWLKKIQASKESLMQFYSKHQVPFSRSQYYKYLQRIDAEGMVGIQDKRAHGGNRKVSKEVEAFVNGCIAGDSRLSNQSLRDRISREYGYQLSLSGITRMLQRSSPSSPQKRHPGRPRQHPFVVEMHNPCGGFELITAIAYHVGWPAMVADAIVEAIKGLKKTRDFRLSNRHCDMKGRRSDGKFTSKYNRRKDIRQARFSSIAEKRETKNWQSLNIVRDQKRSIERKCMAVLSLPVVTLNGTLRTVDSGLGQALAHFAGFDYKQASLTKYLNELKYVGVSSALLERVATFWRQCWGSPMSDPHQASLQCYYIDGNTKPLWSSKRVKQNKVTMLGRVMGCLEHVFIHDCFGHPIYFETYSGAGVRGEEVLGIFEKLQQVLNVRESGSRAKACRVIVMDGANNSVGTLRAFAQQHTYHYITTLDDNQCDERKMKNIGLPARYSYGNATLREAIIELEDSQEKGYLVESRVVKINWDNGKKTALITSLPVTAVRASEVVRSYFARWPSEELQFRGMKSSVALHRVAGYGRQKVEDEEVARRQRQSLERIDALTKQLKGSLDEIARQEERIAILIPERRRICEASAISGGKRSLPPSLMAKLKECEHEISGHERMIKKIESGNSREFRLLRKHQREWLRLQGKETVYKVDVELDQIMTFHRVSLANLYAYFIKNFLAIESMSAISLLHRILHLPAKIHESADTRHVQLTYNKKDERLMVHLQKAIDKINTLKIAGIGNKQVQFSLDVNCLK